MRTSFLVSGAFVAMTAAAATPQWAEERKSWAKNCEAEYAAVEKAGGPLLDVESGEPRFRNAGATLRVARRMGEAHGALPASFDVARAFAARLAKGETLSDVSDFFKVETGCRTVGYFRLGKAALNGIAAYQLKGQDAKTVTDGVAKYVRRDLEQPLTLIDVLIRLELATRMARAEGRSTEKLDALRLKAEVLKDRLRKIATDESKGAMTAEGFAKWPEAKRKAWSDMWREEIQGTAAIRKELLALLE